ncbi:MAG TPA: alkaline phosphatase D family protein [Bryobacteraceae bacterium]|nr:alkaline phosphatase D family protein [Bryobacteraceae bacterium]
MTRRTTCKLLMGAPALMSMPLAETETNSRQPWIGPQFWSNPLQDWQLRNGRIECIASGGDRNVFLLTKELGSSEDDFLISVALGHLENDVHPLTEGFAGFRIGIRGQFDDYRDSAIYGRGMNIGVASDGRLFIGSVDARAQMVGNFPRDIRLQLRGRHTATGYTLELSAFDPAARPLAHISRDGIAPKDLEGGVALVCSAGPIGEGLQPSAQLTMSGPVIPLRKRHGEWRFWFRDWRVSGAKFTDHPERAFGPILWTMYTVHRGVLKLTAQMAAVGESTEQVRLEIRRGNDWTPAASSRIDALARTATFRVNNWDATADARYRVLFRWNAEEHIFEGTAKRDPLDKPKIVLAALSCLNDFGFPHADLLRSIQHFEPDLVAFQGDQIYERSASYDIQRAPLDSAVLDFLRKWYLFGWSFRDIMRDTPTICQTDDHDMYQGNIWGAAGRHAEGQGQEGQDSGGYLEPATWVNTVQRCQTSHLPDPFDPTPVDQNISVYYTTLLWGGVSFAILEDRKWKSAPKLTLPEARIQNGWAQNPAYQAARDGNVPQAELYGARQLKFLESWARDWQHGAWMKLALTQTLMANLATLPPPANTDAVDPKLPIPKPGDYIEGDVLVADHDSNAWPQAGRNRALAAFRRCAALHVCGDQHLGSTIQYGVEEWNDAAFAFCSPALSNLFPRRWYPPQPGVNPLPAFPRSSGEYRDGFGNKMTVHAHYNPQQSDAEPNFLMDRSPGFGIIELERDTRAITISLWPRRIDSREPGARQAPGWPVRIQQLDNGWSSCEWELPPVRAPHLRDFCIEVHDQKNGEWLYTLRVKGEEFTAPVRHAGFYSVRVFDPDSGYQNLYESLGASRKS